MCFARQNSLIVKGYGHSWRLNSQWLIGKFKKEKEGFLVGRQKGAEERAARTLRDAEDVQGQLQEKAGGQTPTV